MGSTRYDVILHGFPNGTPSGDPPVVALAAAFGLTPPQAERFVTGLPRVVKHEADAALASRYEQVLRGIGASVEVRTSGDVDDARPMRPDATFRPGMVRPAAVQQAAAAEPADPAEPAEPAVAEEAASPDPDASGPFGAQGGLIGPGASRPGGDPSQSEVPPRPARPPVSEAEIPTEKLAAIGPGPDRTALTEAPATPAPPPVNEPEPEGRPAQLTPGDAVLAVGATSANENSGLAWDEAIDGPSDAFSDGPSFDPDAPFELAARPAPDRAAPSTSRDPVAGLSANDPLQSSIGGNPEFSSPSGLELELPATGNRAAGRSAKLPAVGGPPEAGPPRRVTDATSAIPDRVPRTTAPPTADAPLELVDGRASSRSGGFEPAEVGTPISGVHAVPSEPMDWLDAASGRKAPADRKPGATSPIPDTRFTGRDFGSSVPVALLMPLSPEGLKWLGITSAAAIFLGALSIFASFLILFGLILILVGSASLLTLNAFCFQAFMASAADDGDEPMPFPSIVDWKSELAFPGFLIILWFGCALVPYGVWTGGLGGSGSGPIGFVLALAPMLLWPMAATVACVDGTFVGLFQFPRILAGIARAPLRYLAVIAIGIISGVVVMIAAQFVIGDRFLSLLLGLFLMNAGFAYGNGVMGAMMGRLVANEPDLVSI